MEYADSQMFMVANTEKERLKTDLQLAAMENADLASDNAQLRKELRKANDELIITHNEVAMLLAKIGALMPVYEAAGRLLRFVEKYNALDSWFIDLDEAFKKAKKVLEEQGDEH